MNGVISLIGLPLVLSPLVYVVGNRSLKSPGFRVQWLASGILILMWILLAVIATDRAEVNYTLGDAGLTITDSSLVFITLTLLLASPIFLFSTRDMAGEIGEEKYYAMLLLLTGMVIGLVCADDLFNLWVWYEGMAISSYLLVAFYRQRTNALGACVKYFVQTVSGSILVLFGIALVFLDTGSLDFGTLSMEPSLLSIIVGALFIMGFGVKAALVPNYTWLPDAYAESPTGVSAYLSGVVTLAGLYALLKALSLAMWTAESWGALLVIIGTANIVLGNFLALAQTQVKRILAYSSISHIGFIALAFGIGIITQADAGMRGGMLHLFIHGIMKSLAFLVVGALVYALTRKSSTIQQIKVGDLAGVGKRYPAMALALTIALLSLAGMPPLAGFFSKLQILVAGVESENGWILLLTAFAAINSVFSLAYYLPIINALYFSKPRPVWNGTDTLPITMRLPVFFLALLLVVLGLWPALIDGLINPAAEAFLALFLV